MTITSFFSPPLYNLANDSQKKKKTYCAAKIHNNNAGQDIPVRKLDENKQTNKSKAGVAVVMGGKIRY